MTELNKTIRFAGAAVVLALLAFITVPSAPRPDAFTDKGELFFADFQDPNEATSLEVIDFDQETGQAIPFKVEFKNGLWKIPSHHDHPADGKDRLAKTAAGVIGITKDDFRTDVVSDHALCGVIDPLDEAETSLEGRGKRVTLRGSDGEVLADFIVGKEVEGSNGYRFVRVPEHKRVYAVKMDIDISTTFADWIEKDLLLVDKDKIQQVHLKDYSVNERTGIVDQRAETILTKAGSDWNINSLRASEELDKTKVNNFITGLDELNIVGVRPKPAGLSASLTKDGGSGMSITQSDALSLQSKGFFFSRDGQLVSNEGELTCLTSEGVEYTLRFGEIVYGSGDDVSAGSDANADKSAGPGENRYLFITTRFVDSMFPEPNEPANLEFQSKADSVWTNDDHANKALFEAHDKWQKEVDTGRTTSADLNKRFSDWYYVISSASFDKVNLSHKDFVKEKKDDK